MKAGDTVGVLGAGSWGTALAWLLGGTGRRVQLWCRDPARAQAMQASRCNDRYLPGTTLPDTVAVTRDLAAALAGDGPVIVAVPAQAVRAVLQQSLVWLGEDRPVIIAAKGLEQETGLRLSQVAAAVMQPTGGSRSKVQSSRSSSLPTLNLEPSNLEPPEGCLAVLSGPNLSGELVRQAPTTTVIASHNAELARSAQQLLATPFLRVYTNSDVTGVELGGALKNIVALGAGISDGLGYGDNTKAALITRGLAEMTRLGVRCGARAETFMGLSGLGDLVATCGSRLSRNHALGTRLGRGESLEAALTALGQVAEGVPTSAAALRLAQESGVEMPITAEVYRVLYEGRPPREAVASLMARSFRDE